MLDKVKINKLDTKEEKNCKRIFNANYFGVFNKNYDKFKKYSKLIGSYQTKKYVSDNYDYYYIKENHPEFIDPEKYITLDKTNSVLLYEGNINNL